MTNDAKDRVTASVLRRLLPVAILLAGLALFLLFRLDRFFSYDMLSRHQSAMTDWVVSNAVASALLFILIYAGVVAFSLPVAVLVTPVGGFLFGLWTGALLSVIGATLGSVAVFLAARTAFRDLFHARAGSTLARFEEGFRRDDFSYLLFLRLVPLFPFWLVNIVPALLGMRFNRYVIATLIGIVPAAVVYSSVGAGLGAVLARGERPDLGIIFEWRILLPLLGLAVLALLPVAYSRFRDRGASS